MKKVFKLTGLDCPNCAMKLEKKLNGVKGVNSAQVNFMAMRLTLDIDDDKFDSVLE
ncbi:MAG: cation transporter [Clostridia bacterium]|nr:cation transporter [Clostridia bacterium]